MSETKEIERPEWLTEGAEVAIWRASRTLYRHGTFVRVKVKRFTKTQVILEGVRMGQPYEERFSLKTLARHVGSWEPSEYVVPLDDQRVLAARADRRRKDLADELESLASELRRYADRVVHHTQKPDRSLAEILQSIETLAKTWTPEELEDPFKAKGA